MWTPWKKTRKRRVHSKLGKGERELRILMDLTDSCNLKCVMCHFSLPGRSAQKNEISLDEFRRFADDVLPSVGHLGLSCATEPFMNPDFLDALDVAMGHGVPWVYFVTNGTLLTEDAARRTIASGVHLVILSLDGATKSTFESIRRQANFDKVLRNVRRLRDLKEELKSATPRLQFNITLMRDNLHELEDWIRLVKELGGEDVDLRHVVPYDGLSMEDQTLSTEKERTNEALDRARALCAELGLRIVSCPENFTLETAADPAPSASLDASPIDAGPADAAPPTPPIPAAAPPSPMCDLPWTMMEIHPDGGVVPCTNWHTHELMGNIRHERLPDIWNGPRYQKLRRELLTGELGPNCSVCPAMGCGSVDEASAFEARSV